MAAITPPIPDLDTTGAQPATDIVDALGVICDEINGKLDNDNLAAKGIRSDRWPGFSAEKVKEFRASPNISLVGGPALPYLPQFTYGTQTVMDLRVPAVPTGNLRLSQIEFRYTKSGKFDGGNDPNNELQIRLISNQGALFSHYAEIPGTVGTVTDRTVYLTNLGSQTAPGSASSVGGWIVGTSASYPDARLMMTATGPDGPFSGAFTIHEIVFRYCDLEFS